MLYLADEMFRQRGKEIRLVFGKKIPWQTFDKSRSAVEWAEWVKAKSYELESLESVIIQESKKRVTCILNFVEFILESVHLLPILHETSGCTAAKRSD